MNKMNTTTVTKVIPGFYGKAVLKDGQWTVFGGYSQNSEDECVFVVDPDYLPELNEDAPVYASCSQFDGKEKITDPIDYVTKEELFDAAQDFLIEHEKPVTEKYIEGVAIEALNMCDWQGILGYIDNELDEHFDLDGLFEDDDMKYLGKTIVVPMVMNESYSKGLKDPVGIYQVNVVPNAGDLTRMVVINPINHAIDECGPFGNDFFNKVQSEHQTIADFNQKWDKFDNVSELSNAEMKDLEKDIDHLIETYPKSSVVPAWPQVDQEINAWFQAYPDFAKTFVQEVLTLVKGLRTSDESLDERITKLCHGISDFATTMYQKFGICDEDFVKFYVCRVDKKNRDMQRNWHYQGNDGVIDDNKLSAVFEDVLDYVEDVVKELIK